MAGLSILAGNLATLVVLTTQTWCLFGKRMSTLPLAQLQQKRVRVRWSCGLKIEKSMSMKSIFQILCTVLISFLAEQWLPWWSVVICAALVAASLPVTQWAAFKGGFGAISLLWMLRAVMIDVKTKANLSTKMATLFGLPGPVALILLTGLIGGFVGGMGAWSGQLLRNMR